tara:strand:- start:4993 stop:5607 length:615 start_codon:yes stop_codon:yes gene_type:complete
VKQFNSLNSIKGFMDPEEGEFLYSVALEASKRGPIVEIGSYCGKSSIYIGKACEKNNSLLFAIDHHTGSEENQVGWEYHDKELFDSQTGRINTFPEFRKNIRNFNLENFIIPIVSDSVLVAKFWTINLSMVFIDGGHSKEAAFNDYNNWNEKIMKDGFLAIHDVFPNPEDGGRPPYEVYLSALNSGKFKDYETVKSLKILKKIL